MGKKIWQQKSVSNGGSNFRRVSVSNNNSMGRGSNHKSNDTLFFILKILALLIVVGVAVVLVLDWYGILKLGIFPKQEEKENGNGNN